MKMNQSICFSRGFFNSNQLYHPQRLGPMVVRPQRALYFGNVSSTRLGKKSWSWK